MSTLQNNIDIEGTPSWFTKNYLENCLRAHYGDDNLKLQSIKAHPALGKGANYCGDITRVKADFQTSQGKDKTGHYIVKTLYEDKVLASRLSERFNREILVYENVLSKLNKLLIEIDDNEQIFAETIAVDYKRSALVFEDLRVRNFTMPNRLDGLDEQLTKIVLRKLAKMHATSVVLNERENGVLENFDRGFFNRHEENYKPFAVGFLEAGTELISQWQGFEMIVEKLKALKPMYMEFGKRVFDPTKGHVNVFAHGDLWTNNIMVKYDDNTGEPEDAIILDFQNPAWGSPAIDLYYLLNSSLKEELHNANIDEFIKYYYTIFKDTLIKLQFKVSIPSLHRFHLQLEEKEFYAFNSTFVILTLHRNEFTDDADFGALIENTERGKNFRRTCFKNAYCQRIIRRLLPVYERRGLLDVDQ